MYLCTHFDVTGDRPGKSVAIIFLISSLLRQNIPTWRLRSDGCLGGGSGGSLLAVVGFGLCFAVVDWITLRIMWRCHMTDGSFRFFG